MEERKKIVLIDFSWVIMRSYHVFRNLSAVVDGQPVGTGTMYGIVRTIELLRGMYPNAKLVFCMDPFESGNAWRKKKYPWYKAGRPEKTDEFNLVNDICSMISGVPNCSMLISDTNEADDVIATVARSASESGTCDVIIHAADNDLMQLLALPRVQMLTKLTADETVYVIPKDVYEKHGVYPEDLLMYRAIVGDPSDKINGILPRLRKTKAVSMVERCKGNVSDLGKIEIRDEINKELKVNLSDEVIARYIINLELMFLYDVPIEEVVAEPKSEDYFIGKYDMRSVSRIL